MPGTDLSDASRGSGRVSFRAGAGTEGRARGQARSSLRRQVSPDRAGLAARQEEGCPRARCRSRTDASGSPDAEGGRPRRGESAQKECGEPRAAGGASRSACRHVEGNDHAPYLAARGRGGIIHRVRPVGRRAALRAAVASRRRHVSLPPASRCGAPLASSAAAASVTSSACRNASPSSHRRRARGCRRWRCYCGC